MALYTTLVRVPPDLLDSITGYDGFHYATGTFPREDGSEAEKSCLPKTISAEAFHERSLLELLREAEHARHPFTVYVPANHPGVDYPLAHTFGDGTRYSTPEEVVELAARLRAAGFEEAPVKDVSIERVDNARWWARRLREFYEAAARAGQAVIAYR